MSLGIDQVGRVCHFSVVYLEGRLNKLLALYCATACLSPAFVGAGDLATQCVVGAVKLSWMPVKRCIVFQDEAKFKATLDAWGWGAQSIPAINWSKQAVVLDSGNNPYGNAVATCSGLFSAAGKPALTLRWEWRQNIVPSSVSRAKTNADAKAKDSGADHKTIGDKAKESVVSVATDAKQTAKDIVEDAKKFPSPIPKRAALIAVFPKELLSAKPEVDCVVHK